MRSYLADYTLKTFETESMTVYVVKPDRSGFRKWQEVEMGKRNQSSEACIGLLNRHVSELVLNDNGHVTDSIQITISYCPKLQTD